MLSKPALILALLLSTVNLFGQHREFGLAMGAANYQGDLAPRLVLAETQPYASLFYRRNINGFFALRGELSFAQVSGDDKHFEANQPRNLHFRSPIYEVAGLLEFNFQKYLLGLRSKDFTPYVFAGIGVAYFNPQAQLDGTWHDLRPLSTEGQGIGGADPYSPFLIALPMGGGFKWKFTRRLNLGAYLTYRFTYTDYLDDVSGTYFEKASIVEEKGTIAGNLSDRRVEIPNYTDKERGNPDRNDWYAFFGFSLSYMLLDEVCFQF